MAQYLRVFVLCVYQRNNFSLLHQHILFFKQIIMAKVSRAIILCYLAHCHSFHVFKSQL